MDKLNLMRALFPAAASTISRKKGPLPVLLGQLGQAVILDNVSGSDVVHDPLQVLVGVLSNVCALIAFSISEALARRSARGSPCRRSRHRPQKGLCRASQREQVLDPPIRRQWVSPHSSMQMASTCSVNFSWLQVLRFHTRPVFALRPTTPGALDELHCHISSLLTSKNMSALRKPIALVQGTFDSQGTIDRTVTDEIVIALCGPMGTPLHAVAKVFKDLLEGNDYKYEQVAVIRLSELIRKHSKLESNATTEQLIEAGNQLREDYTSAVLAQLAVNEITIARAARTPAMAAPSRQLALPGAAVRPGAHAGEGLAGGLADPGSPARSFVAGGGENV